MVSSFFGGCGCFVHCRRDCGGHVNHQSPLQHVGLSGISDVPDGSRGGGSTSRLSTSVSESGEAGLSSVGMVLTGDEYRASCIEQGRASGAIRRMTVTESESWMIPGKDDTQLCSQLDGRAAIELQRTANAAISAQAMFWMYIAAITRASWTET